MRRRDSVTAAYSRAWNANRVRTLWVCRCPYASRAGRRTGREANNMVRQRMDGAALPIAGGTVVNSGSPFWFTMTTLLHAHVPRIFPAAAHARTIPRPFPTLTAYGRHLPALSSRINTRHRARALFSVGPVQRRLGERPRFEASRFSSTVPHYLPHHATAAPYHQHLSLSVATPPTPFFTTVPPTIPHYPHPYYYHPLNLFPTSPAYVPPCTTTL